LLFRLLGGKFLLDVALGSQSGVGGTLPKNHKALRLQINVALIDQRWKIFRLGWLSVVVTCSLCVLLAHHVTWGTVQSRIRYRLQAPFFWVSFRHLLGWHLFLHQIVDDWSIHLLVVANGVW